MSTFLNITGVFAVNLLQKIKKCCFILYYLVLTHSIISAQFWSHNFESIGGYTASITEFSDGVEDYWGRIDLTNKVMTDGTAIGNGASSVSGFGGDWVFGGCDIDGEGAILPVNIVFDDINISGKDKLLFQVKLAEDDDGILEDWDASDYVRFYYDIDNSGTWSNLLFIENDSSTTNTAPGIDSDFDGDNNGTLITDTFVLFEKYISGTGSTIDIKIEWKLNAGDEDLYIDNLALYDGITISGSSNHFRMMSSPVAGQIYSDLLAELWTQGMTSADVTSGDANVWTYDGSNWNALNDITGSGSGASLTAGQGFLVYVFTDIDNDGDDDLPVTLSVSGTENSSSATVPSSGSIADAVWELAGNPYASTLDWDLVTQTNVTTSAYVWDSQAGTPAYISWNGSAGSLTDGLIAPYQGFFIQGSGGSGSITIETADKSSVAGSFYKTMNDSTGSIRFSISSGNYSDETFLSFTSGGVEGMDNSDAYKLLPMTPSERIVGLTYTEGNGLDINNLPYIHDGSIDIPLDLMSLTVDADYNFVTNEEAITLNWDLSNLPETVIGLTLTNNSTNETTDLLQSDNITVTTQAKGSFPSYGSGGVIIYPQVEESQFTLTVQYSALSSNEESIYPKEFAMHPAYPNPFNPTTRISFDVPVNSTNLTSLQIFNIKGQLVETLVEDKFSAGTHTIQWNPWNLSTGIYFVQLKAGEKVFNQKITFIK